MPYWFDGNNLIGRSAAASRTAPEVRKAFLHTRRSLHRSGGGKFLVYFDGDDPDRVKLPPGVAVRYSAPLSADDAIVRRLQEIQNAGEVIVVTNDRELRTQVRNHGAKSCTWQEFMSRMQSRSTRTPQHTVAEKPINVEEWIEYFGLDKSKI